MNAFDPDSRALSVPAGGDAGWLPAIELSVYSDIGALEAEWRDFEKQALGTFYQTFAWCSAWQETATPGHSDPVIVIGRDAGRQICFLLPLSVRRRMGARVLEFLGTPQTTYGYGLYAPSFLPVARLWFNTVGWRIPRLAGAIDAIHLASLPGHLHGFAHPLADWFTCSGANPAYRLDLAPGYTSILKTKRSAASRRGQRKRDARLEEAGELSFGLPASRGETHALIDRMFEQQRHRLAQRGIHGVFGEHDRAFIHRLADLEGPDGPALLPYRLTLDGELVTVKLGGLFQETFWALISSFDADRVPHLSPGDAALRRTIEACCRRGLHCFDLASGDTGYKRQWADEIVPLHECIRGITAAGFAWAAGKTAQIAAKGAVKRSPVLWPLASALRQRLAGRSS